MSRPEDSSRLRALSDDLPPSGEEAREQRRQGLTPMLWMVLGLLLVLLFVAFMSNRAGLGARFSAAAGPAPVRLTSKP